MLTQQSQVPVIPKDSDDDDLHEKIIDSKKNRPVETFKRRKIIKMMKIIDSEEEEEN